MLSIKDLSLHDTQPEIPKATEKVLLMNDRISNLPDDILLRIISSLTLKEAGSTSVLSKRWRHVWTYVPHLNFDASEILDKMDRIWTWNPDEEVKYLHWVDQVVNSHKAQTIDEFRIRFNFENNRDNFFDNWLRFAMEKRVRRLEFNVLALYLGGRGFSYTLPSLTPWRTLNSLELTWVDVTGEVLQKFLSDCPNLELLSVTYSTTLEDLKVVGSLKLKCLKLWHCFGVEHLEISSPNLISFHYFGPVLSWPLEDDSKDDSNVTDLSWPLTDASNVTELSLGGYYGKELLFNYSDLSSCMSKVEVFTLTELGEFDIPEDFRKVFPVAPRLKMLHIGYIPKTAEDLFVLTFLIKSCPLLHELKLQLDTLRNIEMTDATRGAEVFPHDKLKILEIGGFAGFDADLGFTIHLIKTFVSVEKITIKADAFISPIMEGRYRAKEKAQILYTVVKPGMDLEILCPELPKRST